ncbi:hypothetical protein [Xanthomonas theicola]|uniref:hypothetical protein n=1 Tax=Xanthomonas theicola TaxID=56464 RepID=UPI000FF88ABF|nr:hypothetical protein [Xanthomonas theicola]QNH24758.1 hypothetical protein G4Q83_08380 [Xanthomonas theicola]
MLAPKTERPSGRFFCSLLMERASFLHTMRNMVGRARHAGVVVDATSHCDAPMAAKASAVRIPLLREQLRTARLVRSVFANEVFLQGATACVDHCRVQALAAYKKKKRHNARNLPYPRISCRAAGPQRAQRHVADSIATLRWMIAIQISAKLLDRKANLRSHI